MSMLRLHASLTRSALRGTRHGSGLAVMQSMTRAVSQLERPSSCSAMTPLRFASTSASSDTRELVYEGPMSRAVRLMKGVSVTSCILTSIGMPTLCLISEQSASMVGKWAMCGTIMLFGFGTTTLFHVLFKPYVIRMWLDQSVSMSDPTVTVQTVTLFSRLTEHHFQLSEVTRPQTGTMHPMVSFRAGDKHFFIHPEMFEDEKLIKKLMGDQYEVPSPVQEDEY